MGWSCPRRGGRRWPPVDKSTGHDAHSASWLVTSHGSHPRRRQKVEETPRVSVTSGAINARATTAPFPVLFRSVSRDYHQRLLHSARHCHRVTVQCQNVAGQGTGRAAHPVGRTSMLTCTFIHATKHTHGDACPCGLSPPLPPPTPLPYPVTFPLASRPPPAPQTAPPGPRPPPRSTLPPRWTPRRRRTEAPAAG